MYVAHIYRHDLGTSLHEFSFKIIVGLFEQLVIYIVMMCNIRIKGVNK